MNLPVCAICDVAYPKMETLNTHMKLAHDESDHMRITRLTETYEAALQDEHTEKTEVCRQTNAKSLDCTECGVIFLSSQEQKTHIEKHHTHTESQIQRMTMYCQFCDKQFRTKKGSV